MFIIYKPTVALQYGAEVDNIFANKDTCAEPGGDNILKLYRTILYKRCVEIGTM